MKKDKYKTVRVTIDVDADGDIYVDNGKGKMCYAGMLLGEKDRVITDKKGEVISSQVPNRGYLEVRKITKK